MSSPSSSRCQGRHVFPIFLEMSGKTCLPCLHLRCWGRHVFPIFPNLLGKTCLPHLPLRCWGKTCLPCLPRDVGEDIWGCWGRHSEMLGKTGTLGKTLKAVREDIKEDGDDAEDTWGQRGCWGRLQFVA